MLRLTGAKADGWIPSVAYLGLEQLPDMNARIDEAATNAGRRPEDIRRLLNIDGSFGGGSGFLQGPPEQWAEQLTQLTLSTGTSAYILSVSSADDLRRFAEEVAPATRDQVADERGAPDQESPTGPVVIETTRPAREPSAGQHLIDVHDALLGELTSCATWSSRSRPARARRPPCGRSSTA
jgi:hypothetical protein